MIFSQLTWGNFPARTKSSLKRWPPASLLASFSPYCLSIDSRLWIHSVARDRVASAYGWLKKALWKVMWITPPRAARALIISSVRLRGALQIARQHECDAITGAREASRTL